MAPAAFTGSASGITLVLTLQNPLCPRNIQQLAANGTVVSWRVWFGVLAPRRLSLDVFVCTNVFSPPRVLEFGGADEHSNKRAPERLSWQERVLLSHLHPGSQVRLAGVGPGR